MMNGDKESMGSCAFVQPCIWQKSAILFTYVDTKLLVKWSAPNPDLLSSTQSVSSPAAIENNSKTAWVQWSRIRALCQTASMYQRFLSQKASHVHGRVAQAVSVNYTSGEPVRPFAEGWGYTRGRQLAFPLPSSLSGAEEETRANTCRLRYTMWRWALQRCDFQSALMWCTNWPV